MEEADKSNNRSKPIQIKRQKFTTNLNINISNSSPEMSLRLKLNRPITKTSNLVRITEEEEQVINISNNMLGLVEPRARLETLTNLAFQA